MDDSTDNREPILLHRFGLRVGNWKQIALKHERDFKKFSTKF